MTSPRIPNMFDRITFQAIFVIYCTEDLDDHEFCCMGNLAMAALFQSILFSQTILGTTMHWKFIMIVKRGPFWDVYTVCPETKC